MVVREPPLIGGDLAALALVSRGLGGAASAFPALMAPAALHFFCLLRAPPCQGVDSSGTGPLTHVCLSRAQHRRARRASGVSGSRGGSTDQLKFRSSLISGAVQALTALS